ncbi:hypothetical protein ACSLPG_36960, partial [Escherichia coli]|uniref:hypothetical protein n=1 Tax=Escherichia coli TaxID=562 RepID=UPI003EDF9D19
MSRIEEIIFLTPEHISGDLCQFCKCYIFRTSGFAKIAKAAYGREIRMVDTEIWLRLMSISSLYGDDMVRIAHWLA